MFSQRRKCQSCLEQRGFAAFDNGETTCKRCKLTIATVKWEDNGEITFRECNTCGEEKNVVTDFSVTAQLTPVGNCKKCVSKNTKRYKPVSKPKCLGSFIFDNQRWCPKCEETKDVRKFYNSNLKCRGCLGMGELGDDRRAGGRNRVDRQPDEKGRIKCFGCLSFKHLDKFGINNARVNDHLRTTKCKECKKKMARKRTADRAREYQPVGKNKFVEQFNNMKEDTFNDCI